MPVTALARAEHQHVRCVSHRKVRRRAPRSGSEDGSRSRIIAIGSMDVMSQGDHMSPSPNQPHRASGAYRSPRHRSRLAVAAVVVSGSILATSAVGVAAPGSVGGDRAVVTGTLAVGAQGDEVRTVQQALVAAGIDLVGGVDGRFGPMTAQALRAFQLSRGIIATGVVDDATRAALLRSDGSSAPSIVGLSQGATGPAVSALQRALTDVGVNVGPVDGIFGPLTASGLRSYQQARNIAESGVLDAPTVQHLAARARPPAGSAATTPITPAAGADDLVGLGVGARGPGVRALQQRLLDTGLTFLGGADGVFGPATANAVRLFQSNRGLEVTGSVDAETAAALGGSPVPSTGDRLPLEGLAPGSNGPLVAELQNKLISSGLVVRGGADGIFGPVTANALKTFQSARSIEATGRVDQATAQALSEITTTVASQAPVTTPADPAGGYPVFGEQGQRVRDLQRALINAGINVAGGADGIFGTMTAGAVMNFQRSRNLEPTGTVTEQTAQALGLAKAQATPPPPVPSVSLQVFPVQGRCHFSDTWHAPRGGGRLHEGTDIIAAEGRYIYAVEAGTISHVYHDRPGSRAGNGVRLTLADGTYFFYAHLQSIAEGITTGTRVAAGQILGYNGSTGNAGIPHLHFEIHPGGGAAVNPFPALRAINNCSSTDVPPQP